MRALTDADAAFCLDIRSGAHHGPPPPPDVRRVLVLDTERGLLEHADVYERILDEPDVGVLAVVVGDAHGGEVPWFGAGRVEDESWLTFDRPAGIRPPLAGILWVSDAVGSTPSGGRRPDEEASLRQLVDLLRLDGVFDRVLAVVGQMSGGVAATSVRARSCELGADALGHAQHTALRRLAGRGGAPAASPVAPLPLPPTLHTLATHAATGPPAERIPGGAVETGIGRCHDLTDEARRRYAALRTGWRALAPAGHATGGSELLADLADAIDGLRELARNVLRTVDGGPSRSSGRDGRLAAAGLRLPRPEATIEAVDEELAAYTAGLLDARLSLRATAAVIDDVATRSAPVPGADLVDAADRACPPETSARLREPPDFLVRAGTFAGLALTGVAGLLAGTAPRAGLLLGPLLVLATVLHLRSLPSRRPDRRSEGRVSGLRWVAVAGALGTVAGVLAVAAGIPAPIRVLGAVVAVGCLGVTVVTAWRAALAAWFEAAGVVRAEAAVRALDDLLAATSTGELGLVDARLRATDTAGALSDALAHLSTVVGRCAEYAGPGQGGPGGTADPPWLHRTSAGGGQDLLDTVTGDLVDTVVAILGRWWAGPRSGSPDPQADAAAEQALEATLDWHRRSGMMTVPPGSRARAGRGGPLGLLGTDPAWIVDALALDDLRDLVPLSTPRGRRLLTRDPAAQQCVRFAPLALHDVAVAAPRFQPGEDIVWTATGRLAGVLRLTPLGAGAVRVCRPRVEGAP